MNFWDFYYHLSLWNSSDRMNFLRFFLSSELRRIFWSSDFWESSDHLSFRNLLVRIIFWSSEFLRIFWSFEFKGFFWSCQFWESSNHLSFFLESSDHLSFLRIFSSSEFLRSYLPVSSKSLPALISSIWSHLLQQRNKINSVFLIFQHSLRKASKKKQIFYDQADHKGLGGQPSGWLFWCKIHFRTQRIVI